MTEDTFFFLKAKLDEPMRLLFNPLLPLWAPWLYTLCAVTIWLSCSAF